MSVAELLGLKKESKLVRLFSVYDSVAEVFYSPFPCGNEGLAIRKMKEWLSEPSSPFARSPMEYVLYEVGTFADASGRMESLAAPRRVGLLSEWLEPK